MIKSSLEKTTLVSYKRKGVETPGDLPHPGTESVSLTYSTLTGMSVLVQSNPFHVTMSTWKFLHGKLVIHGPPAFAVLKVDLILG